jgi:hypothetical protein
MVFLLKNETARQCMGAAAARRAKDKFDVSVMIKAYEELYETCSCSQGYQNWSNSCRQRNVSRVEDG